MPSLFAVLGLLHLLGALAAVVHILRYYRRPTAAVAWLFAVVVLPLLGPALYLMFSVYHGPRRLRRRSARSKALRAQRAPGLADGASEGSEEDEREPSPFAPAIESVASFPICPGNDVEWFSDGGRAQEIMLETLRSARTEVLVETYALHDDSVGKVLGEELVAAHKRGVKAYLLVDPIGSFDLPRGYLDDLRSQGVEVTTFLKPNVLKGRFQVNSRNHRKILVADGQVAVTGGRNWGEKYFRGPRDEAPFRDLSVRFRGPAVPAIRRVFLEDWCIERDCDMGEFRALDPPEVAGDVPIRVVPHGVDESAPGFMVMAAAAMRRAREEVVIVTPYFVPGPVMQDHLVLTARSGVAVRVVMAERTDSRAADLAARYYFEELLDAGVDIVLVPKPMLHAKAMIVDREWATVGSTNFDCRSFHLNYELNLEIVGAAPCGSLLEIVDSVAAEGHSVCRDSFASRSGLRRMAENAAALFEPIL